MIATRRDGEKICFGAGEAEAEEFSIFVKVVELSQTRIEREKKTEKLKTDKQYKRRQKKTRIT